MNVKVVQISILNSSHRLYSICQLEKEHLLRLLEWVLLNFTYKSKPNFTLLDLSRDFLFRNSIEEIKVIGYMSDVPILRPERCSNVNDTDYLKNRERLN